MVKYTVLPQLSSRGSSVTAASACFTLPKRAKASAQSASKVLGKDFVFIAYRF